MDNYAFRKYSNSKDIKDLINQMLVKNADHRITPEKALRHKFFVKHNLAESQSYVIKESSNKAKANNNNNHINSQNTDITSKVKEPIVVPIKKNNTFKKEPETNILPINVGSLLKDNTKPIDQINIKLRLNSLDKLDKMDDYSARRSSASRSACASYKDISEHSYKFIHKKRADNPELFERQDHKSNFTDDVSPSKSFVGNNQNPPNLNIHGDYLTHLASAAAKSR